MKDLIKINESFYNIFMGWWFLILILIAIGNWSGTIRFGWGLGDIFFQFIILGFLIIMGVFYVFTRYKASISLTFNQKLLTILVCLLFLVFIILKMTYLRGSASRWNGQIFF